MDTPNLRTWSELPHDLLRSIFERLTFADFLRAKIVCSNWKSIAKQTVPQKIKSPCLMLFPDGVDGCVLYNPDENRIYKTERDFSGIKFLGNSGNWFLVLDSRSNLYIIDVFSDDLINLLPLESFMSESFTLERQGDKIFKWQVTSRPDRDIIISYPRAEHLRGLLWVDQKTKEFVVAWFFTHFDCNFLAYYKKGDDHYSHIKLQYSVYPELLRGSDIVLHGYFLYIVLSGNCIRLLDLSKQQGFEDVTHINPSNSFARMVNQPDCSIVVTTARDILVIQNNLDMTYIESDKSFRLYKADPNAEPNKYDNLVEVDSLSGEESVLIDLGITVPGIEPNFIYATCNNHFLHREDKNLDICVFNLATNTLKRFPSLFNMKLKDARWFLPRI